MTSGSTSGRTPSGLAPTLIGSASDNPEGNKLPAGVTEAAFVDAVQISGYPLQTLAANLLAPSFQIVEEWTYEDEERGEIRSLDLYAVRLLYERESAAELQTLPLVELLIECKRSQLPYVFFLTTRPPLLNEFPLVTGTRGGSAIFVYSDTQQNTVSRVPIHAALGISHHPFVDRPPVSLSFAVARRSGKTLELSGEEQFRGLVLPLRKALIHQRRVQKPDRNATWMYLRLTLAVVVLDAPMVTAHVSATGTDFVFRPWVRMVRHEPVRENRDDAPLPRTWAIDVIHHDFITQYVDDHLLPFASEAASAALELHDHLFSQSPFTRDELARRTRSRAGDADETAPRPGGDP